MVVARCGAASGAKRKAEHRVPRDGAPTRGVSDPSDPSRLRLTVFSVRQGAARRGAGCALPRAGAQLPIPYFAVVNTTAMSVVVFGPKRDRDDEEVTCGICLDQVAADQVAEECANGHVGHRSCLQYVRRCPECKVLFNRAAVARPSIPEEELRAFEAEQEGHRVAAVASLATNVQAHPELWHSLGEVERDQVLEWMHINGVAWVPPPAPTSPLMDGDVNERFQQAARQGNVDAIENLLQNEQVDPSADHNAAISIASAYGRLRVVERLLQDPRVDPSDDHNKAIRNASAYGKFPVVELLLQNPRVNPSDVDNDAIRKASENGHLLVVERLLQNPRVNPSDVHNEAIRKASENGHLPVVECLLKDKRVDPSDDNNYAIQMASANGHLRVIERLLKDKRVDPSDGSWVF